MLAGYMIELLRESSRGFFFRLIGVISASETMVDT